MFFCLGNQIIRTQVQKHLTFLILEAAKKKWLLSGESRVVLTHSDVAKMTAVRKTRAKMSQILYHHDLDRRLISKRHKKGLQTLRVENSAVTRQLFCVYVICVVIFRSKRPEFLLN